MSELELILLGGAIGGGVGLLVGAALTVLVVRRRPPPAAAAPVASGGEAGAARRREVAPLMDWAGRVMIAYGHLIDAANAAERSSLDAAVRALHAVCDEGERGRFEGTADRGVADAAGAFVRFVGDTRTRVDNRLASGSPASAIAGELRLRSGELATQVTKLSDALERYVGSAPA